MTLMAKLYMAVATFAFIGGVALLAFTSDSLGWGALAFMFVQLMLFNQEPELRRKVDQTPLA